MATVFMKWLETSPGDYDRGIQLLTLGRLTKLKEKIAREHIHPGDRVLEIGCGTGALTALMAEQGATVSGIDASPAMLAEARKKIAGSGLEAHVTLEQMDATQVGDRFEPASFDLIVSTLVFSELTSDEQRFVLEACAGLLIPGGRLLIADEVVPERSRARLPYYSVRVPLVLLTWLLTRTTTSSLRGFDSVLAGAGFDAHSAHSYLGGSLVLYEARHVTEAPPQNAQEIAGGVVSPFIIGQLHHRVTLRTLLLDLWELFFRLIPPYPKTRTGLYAVGNPDPRSPVLVTGNYDLTVRRLVRAIDGQVDVWLLVADSAGINVWCAAGGGHFTAEKVIAAVKSSHLSEMVSHHALILPQLCANGVDGWKIRKETGWGVHWGPSRARDIPAYVAGHRQKTDAMRWVRFPLKDRLEMVTAALVMYALPILVLVAIFWPGILWPVTACLLGLLYLYGMVHPWLPGHDGLVKSIPLILVSLAGLALFSTVFYPMPVPRLFHWAIGLTGLSVVIGAELQGMSPIMRGDSVNWSREAFIGLGLGLTYWLVPLALGWR